MAVSTIESIAKEICDALGLKHCRKLDIHLEANKIFTVEAELYPEIDGVMQLPAILRKFKLITTEDGNVESEETIIPIEEGYQP